MKDIRKRNHSLNFFLKENIAAVRIMTVSFAISEGCICIGPMTSHLLTFLIGGPKSSVATSSAIVKIYITSSNCHCFSDDRSILLNM